MSETMLNVPTLWYVLGCNNNKKSFLYSWQHLCFDSSNDRQWFIVLQQRHQSNMWMDDLCDHLFCFDHNLIISFCVMTFDVKTHFVTRTHTHTHAHTHTHTLYTHAHTSLTCTCTHPHTCTTQLWNNWAASRSLPQTHSPHSHPHSFKNWPNYDYK